MLSNEEVDKKFKEMKITIAIPSSLIWNNSTSVIWSVALAAMAKPEAVQFKVDAACPLSIARNRLLRSWYDSELDWLLFLDDDVVPPFDTIPQLLKYSDEYDILSGLYFRKSSRKGFKPVAFYNMKKDEEGRWWWNTLLSWGKGATPVTGFGMGCCLIPKRAIKQIIEKQGHPLFHYDQDSTDGWLVDTEKNFYSMGEDLYFCKKAIDSGLKLGVVATVSCEHTGPHLAINEKDYLKAVGEGRMLGQSTTLPIVNVEQALLINDAVNYFHISQNEIVKNISLGSDAMNNDLKKIPVKTQQEKNAFYYSNPNYLYHHLGWNYFYRDKVFSRTQLALISEGKTLDYGGNCGDVSLRAYDLSKDITYYERPGVAYDFFKWRVGKHKWDIKTVELKEDEDTLGDALFDSIICFDFLEFAVDPVKHLARMKAHSHEKTRYLLALDNTINPEDNLLYIKHVDDLPKMLEKAGINPSIVLPNRPRNLPSLQDERFRRVDKM